MAKLLRFRGPFSVRLALRFIQAAREKTTAFEHLQTQCREGAISAQGWARSYGVEGSWIEDYGTNTMQEWRKDPYSLQEMIPYPHFPADNAGTLDQRVEIVLEWNQPFVDSNYGRRLLHQRADELYDRWEGETKNSPDTMGYGSVDLDRNLAYAAMYIFAGKSYAELSNLPGAQLECTVVARAVKSLLQALHLPVRKPGRPRKRAKAEDVG